jgi:hypothetical protein
MLRFPKYLKNDPRGGIRGGGPLLLVEGTYHHWDLLLLMNTNTQPNVRIFESRQVEYHYKAIYARTTHDSTENSTHP